MGFGVQIIKSTAGYNVVVLPDIIFKNKQSIDWTAVGKYLKRYVDAIVTIEETKDIVYIGADFPSEYKGSVYTNRLKGAKAKAKANAVQGIREMLSIATEKRFQKNKKVKHSADARNGWYYYTTRFAVPVYENSNATGIYNIYSACLLINCTKYGRMYLYDLTDIKKEASTPLRTI